MARLPPIILIRQAAQRPRPPQGNSTPYGCRAVRNDVPAEVSASETPAVVQVYNWCASRSNLTSSERTAYNGLNGLNGWQSDSGSQRIRVIHSIRCDPSPVCSLWWKLFLDRNWN